MQPSKTFPLPLFNLPSTNNLNDINAKDKDPLDVIARDKKYTCDLCGKAFNYRKNWENHIKIFHEQLNGSYQCQYCQKPFSFKQNLKKHIRCVHEKVKDHKCDRHGCDKAFSDSAHLKVHIKIVHDNIRDHKCQSCDRYVWFELKSICSI